MVIREHFTQANPRPLSVVHFNLKVINNFNSEKLIGIKKWETLLFFEIANYFVFTTTYPFGKKQ